MLLIPEIIIFFLLGILAGTISGITPGIHINLISAVLLSLSAFLLSHFQVHPISMIVFLVAMSITHTFVDFVPSIFLGAPDEDNFLSILPGHEMLIKGEAYSAILLTLYGGAIGVILILIFSPLFYFFLPTLYAYAEKIMPFILVLVVFFLIYFEKTSRPWAIIIFLLSGILGLATFNLPLKESLLPLFTGLFGVSSLITSITKKQKIPNQKIVSIKDAIPKKKSIFKSIAASIIASPICSFLPGMGSGQAAVIGSEVIGTLDRKEFLILLGSINTIVTGLSFITLYSISKARTGVAAAINDIIPLLALDDLMMITGIIILAAIVSFFITIQIAKFFSRYISKINYSKLSILIIILLIIITFLFSSWLGLLVLLVSTSFGLLCIYAGIRRTHLMGSLIIPAILLYML